MCLGVVSSPLLAAAARRAISLCQRTEWLRQCSGVGGAHAVAKAEEVDDGGGVTGEGCGPAGPLSPPLWLLPLLQGEPKSHEAVAPWLVDDDDDDDEMEAECEWYEGCRWALAEGDGEGEGDDRLRVATSPLRPASASSLTSAVASRSTAPRMGTPLVGSSARSQGTARFLSARAGTVAAAAAATGLVGEAARSDIVAVASGLACEQEGDATRVG